MFYSAFSNYFNQPLSSYDYQTAFSSRGLTVVQNQLWANSTGSRKYILNLKSNEKKSVEAPNLLMLDGEPYHDFIIFRPVHKAIETEVYTAGEELVLYENQRPVKNYYWGKGSKRAMLWSIFKDSNKKVWVGTLDNGIGIIRQDSLINYQQYNEFKELSRYSIYHFLQWDDDLMLIASTGGIYILHRNKGIIGRFWRGGDDKYFIPNNTIHHIHRDEKAENTIWLATRDGLVQLSLNTSENKWTIDKMEHITILNGLSNNVIYAVYEDKNDNLWMSSDYGLMRFNKITQKAKGYTTEDGTSFNEFNRISHFQDEDGQLYFGSMNGITTFHPDNILGLEEDFDIPFRITSFQQFNGQANQLENKTAQLISRNKIILQPKDKFFNLEFALLEYKDAHQVKYSYQLKGQSDEWIYLNNNELRLSGLPYGKYVLNIRAQDVSGQFSSSALSIPIIVKRPFYLQWWFFALSIVLAGAGIWWYNQERIKRLLKQQKILEKTVAQRTARVEADKKTIEQQAEELKTLDAMKSRFFANISHELRTPLTLMLAPIDASLQSNQLTNKVYTHLLMAQCNGKRLLKMVNEILDLTKLEASTLTLKKEKVEWHSFLKLTLAQFNSLADSKMIKLNLGYHCSPILNVEIDKEKVEIILNNLLSNALKFTSKYGTIELMTYDEDEMLSIKVSDNGSGIHPDDLPFIFDRFYQTKRKNKLAQGGTGIGLSLTHELVKLMNGTIEVKSELGEGSTFTVSIPKIKVSAKTPLSPSVDEFAQDIPIEEEHLIVNGVSENNIAKETILLVEDHPDLHQFIRSILENKYDVVSANNGKEALNFLSKQDVEIPALVVSDIMMPIMDGFQLVDRLKSSAHFQHIPVIMLTARVELKDKLKALRIGVDDYLTKPFVQEELLVRIQNLLKNASRRTSVDEVTVMAVEEEVKNKIVIDTEWLEKVENLILERIEKIDFVIDEIVQELDISRRQMHRRIKAYVGQTPNQYIKTLRLTKARTLLEEGEYMSVKAVSISVGFKDVKYFSIQFKKEFGRLPSSYL